MSLENPEKDSVNFPGLLPAFNRAIEKAIDSAERHGFLLTIMLEGKIVKITPAEMRRLRAQDKPN